MGQMSTRRARVQPSGDARPWMAAFVPIVALLLVPLVGHVRVPAHAQSLADLARQEEERRKTIRERGKLYTNKDLPAVVRDLRARAEKTGRQPNELSISVVGAPGEEAVLRQYQELGIERAIFFVPSEGKDKVLPLVDKYAALIPKVA